MSRILVVDDDQVLQRMIQVILQKSGHHVIIAENSYSALEKLSRESFDLIISDANMPGGLSGFDLVATIKKDFTLRHIPVIFLTGRGQKDDVVKAGQAGVAEYLIKPVNHVLLEKKVKSLLEAAAHPKVPVTGDLGGSASAQFHFRVIHVTQQGIELLSPIGMPVNFETRLSSDLLSAAGLASPLMKVSLCVPFKVGAEAFKISALFSELTLDQETSLYNWLATSPKKIAS